jgi:glycosyltransferase involved in cell wall biosynthesis
VDRYLSVSRAVAEGNGLAGVAEVVPNFVPDSIGEPESEAHPLVAELPSEPFMLFVGDLNRQKGILVLLDAYRRLQDAPPLVLIGRRFPEIPEELPKGVTILSKWPHAAVLGAWQRCLFGLAPSVWPEPCATVVMEGMAFGKSMIVTNTGGMPDIVGEGEGGLLVKPGDPADLARAMMQLLEDASKRVALGAGALERVERFKASAVIDRIEGIYRELLSGGGAERRPQASAVSVAA